MAPIQAIAQRVRKVRLRLDMTQGDLAEALKRAGIPWERSTVAKLESNRRPNVSVNELLALALVLDCSPVHLLVPNDDQARYQVAAGRDFSAAKVRNFVRGLEELPGQDWRNFAINAPEGEYTEYVSGRKRYIVDMSEEGDGGDGPGS